MAKKSELPKVPTNVSAFANDAGYLTEHQSLADYAKKSEVEDLKTSVSEGKALIASAVTDKGVQTADDATFAAMAANIELIEAGIDTSDATASADEIFSGEIAYVDGEKVIGTFTINEELSAQDDLIAQITEAVNNLPEAGSGSSIPSIETCTIMASADEPYSILGIQIINDTSCPIYKEDNVDDIVWEAPCGSIIAIAYPFGDKHRGTNMTYLGEDDGTYVKNVQ